MKAQRAHQIVLEHLAKEPSCGLELVIETERTIRRPYGWIVFYTSKKYLEGDIHGMLFGNGPLVVLIDGRVISLGTGGPLKDRIAGFEGKLKKGSLFYRVLMFIHPPREPVAVPRVEPVMKIDIPGWLEELDAGYCEKYQREVIKPYAEGMAQLKQDYVASIDRLLDAATQAAKLEDTIALRAERQRAAESDGLPVDDSDVSLPSIKALRRGYRVEAMNLGLVRARRAKEQFVRYDLHLAANQSHFTRLQRPDDATLVKTRREQIAAEWPRRPGEP